MTVARTRSQPLTSEQEITHYLFDDVARLPIIINRAQELWLGIQLRAAQRLSDCPDPDAVRRTFAQCRADLAAVPPAGADDISLWARDLLIARHHLYELRRSPLRHFLDALPEDGDRVGPRALTCQTVESLALLPDEWLRDLAHDASADLTPDNENQAAYIARVTAHARSARHDLVTGYLRYVLRVARGYVGQGLDFGDLVQCGFMGLMRAADRFDYRINARFGTYATSWIWQSITRGLAEEGRLVRLPVHIQDKLERLGRLVAQSDTGHGDPLRDPDRLAEAGFLDDHRSNDPDPVAGTQRRVQRLALQAYGALSLDNPPGAALAHTLWAEPGPDEKSHTLRPIVNHVLETLTGRQREVLEMRYGLADGQERTLEEIGQAYGLTRERIRQIEAKALKTVENRRILHRLGLERDVLHERHDWSIPQVQLPPIYPNELWAMADANSDEWAWLDALLARMPHGDWHTVRPGILDGGRRGQLRAALLAGGGPAHFSRLIAAANEVAPARLALDPVTGYNILVQNEDTFLLLGEGVFSLVEWEQARAAEPQPRLPFCPRPLPDPPGFEDALFESIFVARDYLADEPTAAHLVAHLLRWAGADPAVKVWQRQGILSAYYLLDLIPYVSIAGGHNPRLRSTLPAGGVADLRRHCLATLTARLAEMPTFWWLLQQSGLARPAELAQQMAAYRPDDLDDSLHRLYILSGLGAVARQPNGRYRLTPFGQTCAAVWARSPEAEADALIEPAAGTDDLSAWGLW